MNICDYRNLSTYDEKNYMFLSDERIFFLLYHYAVIISQTCLNILAGEVNLWFLLYIDALMQC